MSEPTARVCPRCGEPAGELALCAACGTNLAPMRDMLPTRTEWEAANPGAAPPPPSTAGAAPPGPATSNAPSSWFALRRGPPGRALKSSGGNVRKQALASVAVIAVFAVVVIAGTSSKPPHHRPPGGARASTSSGPTSSTTTPAVTATTPVVAPTRASVATCATAWNGGKSAEHRRDLARAVAHAANPVAVIATYAGPHREVARTGGGNPVLVNAGVCVLAADNLVFLRQPDGSWGLTGATAARFSAIARNPTWTADHANAAVHLGAPATAAGTVSPTKGSLLVLGGTR